MGRQVSVLCTWFCALTLTLISLANGYMVVRSTEDGISKEGKITPSTTTPEIYQMHITSNIRNRFSHTIVKSRVRNLAETPQEVIFSIVLPDTAYISGFIMEVDGKNYTAYIKEKEEAKRDYQQAVASGVSAGHVAVNARDSNRFMVSVNIQPDSKAAFYLNYEQLLDRRNSHYEQIININPGQVVHDLSVEVLIAESRKIIDLKAPPLRSGNEIGTDKPELDPRADIETFNDTAAVVKFSPNVERQKQLAHVFGTKEENGLSGQFVVQYDVERDPSGGEVLIQDGFFVHFFAPSDLEPIPKHAVFVLDTSGSMMGQKIKQLKHAMASIVNQLRENDSISLVEFNSNTKVWNLNNPEESVWYPRAYKSPTKSIVTLENASFPAAFEVNNDIIRKAKAAIANLTAMGSTSMYGGLQVALKLVELERRRELEANDLRRQPIIIFLTDGAPTDLRAPEITTKISEYNSEQRKAPIFALSFGDGADKKFLQKLASRNSGFSKHIYEAADASLQLQDFYRLISSPLLSDVKFEYESTATNVTKTKFPIHFRGSEIIIAGAYSIIKQIPKVSCFGIRGPITFKPIVTTSSSDIERVWAYLTIKQLLEETGVSEDERSKSKKQALELALKYNFVTPVSSLVVVKPNSTGTVDAEDSNPKAKARLHVRLGYAGGHALPIDARPRGPWGPIRQASLSFQKLNGLPHYRTRDQSPSVTKIVQKTSMLQQLLDHFPWLNFILANGLVKGPTASYKLGLNETITDVVPCSNSTNNQEGQCKLLHNCRQAVVPTVNDYYNHFCVVRNEFAGICCPN